MRGKNDSELLLPVPAIQLGKNELIQRQHKPAGGRQLNAQAARLGISGVTFGCPPVIV